MSHAVFIDNDQNSQTLYQIMCNQNGITYYSVRSYEAFEQLLADAPRLDIICLDLRFPIINGYQMLEVLRSHNTFRHVPIAALTVHVEEAQEIQAAGFDSFIRKPVSAKHFIHQLNAIISGKQVWE